MKDGIKSALENTNWRIRDSSVENVFKLSNIEVNATIHIITENELQETLNLDDPVCFIFTSKLSFKPSIGNRTLKFIRNIVVSKTKTEFKNILTEEGINSVQYKGSVSDKINNVQVDTHNYTGTVAFEDYTYDIEAYSMIFQGDDGYYIVGFARPEKTITDIFNIKYSDLNQKEISMDIIDKLIN